MSADVDFIVHFVAANGFRKAAQKTARQGERLETGEDGKSLKEKKIQQKKNKSFCTPSLLFVVIITFS